MRYAGSVNLYAHRSGGVEERGSKFPEPKFHAINGELGEQHRQDVFSEGFKECASLHPAQFNDPFSNLGIIDNFLNIV